MPHNPNDYHVDTRKLISAFLLVAFVFCGAGSASVDLPGTMQHGCAAMAGETHSRGGIHCL